MFGYETAHNEPGLVLEKKLEVNDGLFFVSLSSENQVTGTVMCGYVGHRGWIYSLAVRPDFQRLGIGTALVNHAETALKKLGCIESEPLNWGRVTRRCSIFTNQLDFPLERRVSMGKRLPENIS